MLLHVPDTPPSSHAHQPVVFLAGPIQGAPDWQAQAAARLDDPRWIVASPRRDYVGTGVEFVYERQVDWESAWLARAGATGVVLFWLAAQAAETPGRSYAQTSRFELGEWVAKARLLPDVRLAVGIDEGFGNARYIRRRLAQDLPDVTVVDTLGALCEQARLHLLSRA